jgi:hemolysin activation/secretion protein
LFESISGEAPFFELGAVGGSDSTIGFGGDKFFRGFQSNRFIDHIKFALGWELRWKAMTFSWAKQKLDIVLAPWVDFGRVWNELLPFRLGTIHASTGWGTRITWNDRFVVRGDFAMTQEGSALYVELGHSF